MIVLVLLAVHVHLSYSQGGSHLTCNRTAYKKIGCFENPHLKGWRIFDQLILTDRDWTAEQYGGQEIDWFHWDVYLHGFVCRCLKKLKEIANRDRIEYHHFSLQNHGECWSSKTTHYDFTVLAQDNRCVGEDFLTCRKNASSECTGVANSQYVYHIEETDHHEVVLNSNCHIETTVICSTSHLSEPYRSRSSIFPTTTTKMSRAVSFTKTNI